MGELHQVASTCVRVCENHTWYDTLLCYRQQQQQIIKKTVASHAFNQIFDFDKQLVRFIDGQHKAYIVVNDRSLLSLSLSPVPYVSCYSECHNVLQGCHQITSS